MTRDANKNPEQIARDRIDDRLRAAGRDVQDRDASDFNAGLGIAVREYQTDVGPADYLLFADRRRRSTCARVADERGMNLWRARSAPLVGFFRFHDSPESSFIFLISVS